MRESLPPFNRRTQYILQLVQVFLVGLTLGMTRTVVPAVAERDFGLPRGDLALLTTFVIAFGIVKGAMNFIAGALSETLGRKRVLVMGWIIALPIPILIWKAENWWWIVAATILLGVNQGLTWSMTLTSKLDLARPDRRGLTNGLNEFAGYGAVAIAGVLTAYLSDRLGARRGLLIFGCATIVPALLVALIFVRETRANSLSVRARNCAQGNLTTLTPTRRERGKTFFAICQAGLVEKFIDALMWIVLPLHLIQRGVDLRDVGWAPGLYAMTWGCSQLLTGPLSDRVGRKPLIVAGMLLCAAAVLLMPALQGVLWWSVCACVAGMGMGMLYPALGAAVSDVSPPDRRGAALGVYRFWRDLGYAFGAAMLGVIAWLGLGLAACFVAVGICVGVSGMLFLFVSEETRNRCG